MDKKEKVVEAIRYCKKTCSADDCEGCPYRDDYAGFPRRDCGELSCVSRLLSDILLLLTKEPEVVRCKDCENKFQYKSGRIVCDHIDSLGNDEHDPDWFCADGVKKDG